MTCPACGATLNRIVVQIPETRTVITPAPGHVMARDAIEVHAITTGLRLSTAAACPRCEFIQEV